MIEGKYFSQSHSKSHSVLVLIQGDDLIIQSDEINLRFKGNQCVFETPIANTALVISLPDGGRLECATNQIFLSLLTKKGWLKKFSVFHLENKTSWFIASILVFFVVVFILLKVVILSSSEFLAHYIPKSWSSHLDSLLLYQMDEHFLSESKLPVERQKQITELLTKNNFKEVNIQFRTGGPIRANAFALANNTVVITDELINHMQKNSYILAILLHEVAHLERRHLLSSLLRDSATAFLSFALIGDLAGGSESLSQIGLVLVSRSYSRDKEREADAFAVEELLKLSFSPKCFSEAITQLQNYYKDIEDKIPPALKYFSTHPQSTDRAADIATKYPEAKNCE